MGRYPQTQQRRKPHQQAADSQLYYDEDEPAAAAGSSKQQLYRETNKVIYTGKPGRPRGVKKGQPDPHAKERRKIEENLNKKKRTTSQDEKVTIELATLNDVTDGDHDPTILHNNGHH